MKRPCQLEMFSDQIAVNPKDAIWLDVPNSWPPSPLQLCSVCGGECDNLLMLGDAEPVCENEECEVVASAKSDNELYYDNRTPEYGVGFEGD